MVTTFRPRPWFSRKKTLAVTVAGTNVLGQAGDKSRFGSFLNFNLLLVNWYVIYYRKDANKVCLLWKV